MILLAKHAEILCKGGTKELIGGGSKIIWMGGQALMGGLPLEGGGAPSPHIGRPCQRCLATQYSLPSPSEC